MLFIIYSPLFQAILFVREKDDEELWDTLIQLSRDLPGMQIITCIIILFIKSLLLIDFITGLLQNAGTHIDPTKLIKVIINSIVYLFIYYYCCC